MANGLGQPHKPNGKGRQGRERCGPAPRTHAAICDSLVSCMSGKLSHFWRTWRVRRSSVPVQVIDLTDEAAPVLAAAAHRGRNPVPGPLLVDTSNVGAGSSRKQASPAKASRPYDDEEEPRCAICLEGLKEKLASAPCGHVFHHACLKTSFAKFKYCPRCRKPFKQEKQIHKIFF
jgi:Zinc finger, C3HC4 type (RING finger)